MIYVGNDSVLASTSDAKKGDHTRAEQGGRSQRPKTIFLGDTLTPGPQLCQQSTRDHSCHSLSHRRSNFAPVFSFRMIPDVEIQYSKPLF